MAAAHGSALVSHGPGSCEGVEHGLCSVSRLYTRSSAFMVVSSLLSFLGPIPPNARCPIRCGIRSIDDGRGARACLSQNSQDHRFEVSLKRGCSPHGGQLIDASIRPLESMRRASIERTNTWSTRTSKVEDTFPPPTITYKRKTKRVPRDKKPYQFLPQEQEIMALRCHPRTHGPTVLSLESVTSSTTYSLALLFNTICCFSRNYIPIVDSLLTTALQVREAD